MCSGATMKTFPFLVSLSLLGALSCTPPTSIATFAESAHGAIAQGPPVFADIYESCARRQAAEASVAPNYPHNERGRIQNPAKPSDSSVCAAFVPEVKELDEVSSVLSAYFEAIQELAAFDETSVSGEAEKTGEGISAAAIFSTNQADAVAKLSELITRAFTEHYRRNKLKELLMSADPHVAAISQALDEIVSKDYDSLLEEEERAVNRRYQETGAANDAAVILLLNRAYREDRDPLQRRRAAAKAYSAALRQARDGHHKLAAGVAQMNNKEISLALQPYIAQLRALALSVQTQP
jgi:hypothetical protein